jgi:T4-like virus tail tube protein gp19
VAEELVENGSSRGAFLARGAGIAGLAVGAGVWAGGMVKAPSAEAAGDVRSYTSGHFQLELSGILIGLLKSFDGGAISAEVVEEELEPEELIAKKHIGNVKYEDFTVQIGFSQHKAMYDWINSSWSGKQVRESGAIVLADQDYNAKRSITFEEALLSEVRIPACDASSKETGYMGVKFAPEVITNKKASGKLTSSKTQKAWLPSNFRLKIGDLPCSRVSKIDAFTIKQAIVTEQIGDTRYYHKEPGKLEFPNLKVTFPESDLKLWDAWFTSMVIAGNQEDEKEGTLELLGPSLKAALCTISFFGVGIHKLSYNGAAAEAAAASRKMIAELYVERMEIK